MSNIATDTFTDADTTLLTAHTPNVPGSGTWSALHGATDAYISSPANVVSGTGSFGVYGCPGTPPSADYAASIDFKVVGAASAIGYVGARFTAGGNGYIFGYSYHAANLWELFKLNWAASNTLLASSAVTLADSTTYTLKITVSGTTISGYVNNSLVCTATDSDIGSAGQAGIWVEAASTANTLDNFSWDTLTAVTNSGGILLRGVG